MDKYFQIYDNRPYHDVVICDVSDEKDIEWEPEIVGERKTGAENILLYGVPGAGKSHEIKTKYCSDEKYMERVVFHPDYTYSDFVGQILPRLEKDENGNPIDRMKPTVSTIYELMNNPELTHKGDGRAWFGAVFICIINALSILFADELFRWNLAFQIRNVEKAEPSDWEIAGRYIGWTVIAIMALMVFILGLL